MRGAILLVIAGSLLCSCRPETPAVQTSCAASDAEILAWIERATLPADPAGPDDGCFFDFAWQQLFAVTHLDKGVPRFAAWPTDQVLFPESGSPPRWGTAPGGMRFRQLGKARGLRRSGQVSADIVTEAAALTPLTDQRGRWAHFSLVVNQPEYEYIRCCELFRGNCFNQMAGLEPTPVPDATPPPSRIDRPAGSLELKMAWRVLETCDLPDSPSPCKPDDASRYLTVVGEVEPYSASIQRRRATLGLIGMHIVQKTPQYKDSVWSTFEHVDNAPDCSQKGDPPPSGWSFFNPDCQDPEKTGRCDDNAYCAPCPIRVPADVASAFNSTDPAPKWKIPIDGKTGEGVITCVPGASTIEFNKAVKMPDGTERWINLFDSQCDRPEIPSQVCRSVEVSPTVASLNEQVHRVLGRLGGSTAVLANYKLAGVLWYDGDDLQPEKAKQLANTTMETYLQTLPDGCVTCHSIVPPVERAPDSKETMLFNSALADRSMVFQQMRQFGSASECSATQAEKCSSWNKGCPGG
ncbi:MAG TPA: hypothetical protein VN493_17035 [Thermoanaerobaculia bacterium]|nr:hypothetical protein [Thermoanaerobaculia bacterium]